MAWAVLRRIRRAACRGRSRWGGTYPRSVSSHWGWRFRVVLLLAFVVQAHVKEFVTNQTTEAQQSMNFQFTEDNFASENMRLLPWLLIAAYVKSGVLPCWLNIDACYQTSSHSLIFLLVLLFLLAFATEARHASIRYIMIPLDDATDVWLLRALIK